MKEEMENLEGVVEEKLSKEQKKVNELIRKLIDADTQLIVKVASCDCKKKEKCKVYMKAQEIAKIIDELQELKGEES